MPSFRSLVLALPALVVGLVVARLTLLAEAPRPRTPGRLWADGPLALITTPQTATNRTDLFATGASHMGLLHNAILRGFNSIYRQAPYVAADDRDEFVGYCLAWLRLVKSHHDDEEATLFPRVQRLLRDETIWLDSLREHDEFLGGLGRLNAYLAAASLQPPSAAATSRSDDTFSGAELTGILDEFRDAFAFHFHREIDTISALASHPNAPAPGSPDEHAARAVFRAWGKKTVAKAGYAHGVPFFLMNVDRTAEGGVWAHWPPMPAPVRWALVNVAGAVHSGWWKFSSCDASGRPRDLFAQ